jgi:predicted peptidase
MQVCDDFARRPMRLLASAIALVALLQPTSPGLHRSTFPIAGRDPMTYAIAIPRGYDSREARALVLALHPGGARRPYYGAAFVEQVVARGLDNLQAIIVAPDCPTQSWTDPIADAAVMALIAQVRADYSIDSRRILVTGFSLGGRGTWFMSAHHSDVFTAAVAMAASTGNEALDSLAKIPTYVIHSRDDEVVPFAPAEKSARALEKLGRPVRFEALQDVGHYEMGAYVDSLRRAGRWVADRWKK